MLLLASHPPPAALHILHNLLVLLLLLQEVLHVVLVKSGLLRQRRLLHLQRRHLVLQRLQLALLAQLQLRQLLLESHGDRLSLLHVRALALSLAPRCLQVARQTIHLQLQRPLLRDRGRKRAGVAFRQQRQLLLELCLQDTHAFGLFRSHAQLHLLDARSRMQTTPRTYCDSSSPSNSAMRAR